jgi:hypothetical protein
MNMTYIFRQPTAAPFSPRKIWFTRSNNITLSEQEHNEKTKENRRQTESVPPHYLMIDTQNHSEVERNERTEENKRLPHSRTPQECDRADLYAG